MIWAFSARRSHAIAARNNVLSYFAQRLRVADIMTGIGRCTEAVWLVRFAMTAWSALRSLGFAGAPKRA